MIIFIIIIRKKSNKKKRIKDEGYKTKNVIYSFVLIIWIHKKEERGFICYRKVARSQRRAVVVKFQYRGIMFLLSRDQYFSVWIELKAPRKRQCTRACLMMHVTAAYFLFLTRNYSCNRRLRPVVDSISDF